MTNAMKKIPLLLPFLLLFISCKPSFVRINPESADKAQMNKAYDLGKRLSESCHTSKFKKFSTSEATPKVINGITPDKLLAICNKIRQEYGNFIDMELIEVIHLKSSNENVYRFKAKYHKNRGIKEVRVTMNSDNKASAINSKVWKDEYE